MRKMLNWFYQL